MLRRRHPFLFVVALLAATGLWYNQAGKHREQISVRGFTLPVLLVNLPPDLVIITEVPETVSVRLQGPLSRAFDPTKPLEVLLDLNDAEAGEHPYRISEKDIQLPPDVTIVSLDPSEITLAFEELETDRLAVKAILEGDPAAGFMLGETQVSPAFLRIRGPRSLLDGLDHVETAPVLLEGATADLEVTVEPRLPHPMLRPLAAMPLLVSVEVIPAPFADQLAEGLEGATVIEEQVGGGNE